MRDVVVYGLLAVIVGGALVWMLIAMFSRSEGQWSAQARELGKFRARHWGYKEEVPSLKAHLIPEAADTHYWPALASEKGYEALSGTRKESRLEWRCAVADTLGEAPRLFFTARLPQQLDAREADMPEFVVRAPTTHAEALNATQWVLTTAEPDAASEVLTPQVQELLTHCDGLIIFHAVHDCATFVLNPEKTREDRVTVVDEYIRVAEQLAGIIPENFWA